MIAIIDYNAGNLTSVARAVSYLGFENKITNDVKEIINAERIIFPGVGAAGSAMQSLKHLALDQVIKDAFQDRKPILGICLGSQIILGHSEENDTPCLELIQGTVRTFPNEIKTVEGEKLRLKIPHMGWNSVKIEYHHPVLSGIQEFDEFYFVHGYYPQPDNPQYVIGTTGYGITFASIIGCKNLFATQFHLEKSGRPGLRMLENFCNWKP